MASMTKSDNRLKTDKRKAPHSAWAKGVSGNPKGAPKRGESWGEIIKRIGDMTPIEAAEHAHAIAGKLKTIGGALTLKEAVVVRVYAALLFEPQASLLNAFMERAEGKIPNPIDVTSGGQVLEVIFRDADPDKDTSDNQQG
jgi:hypothetical protein